MSLIDQRPRAASGHQCDGVTAEERSRLAWHLPDDFNLRPAHERAEIIAWVRSVFLRGATPFRRFQQQSRKTPYALRFSEEAVDYSRPYQAPEPSEDPGRRTRRVGARLDGEFAALVRFKTAPITPFGYCRSGAWGAQSVAQRAAHLGMLFGAMVAPAGGEVDGLGAPIEALGLALLAFPRVWRWYVEWRSARRGFHTPWETDMLCLGVSLVKPRVGWLRQSPRLIHDLEPLGDLVTAEDLRRAREDWTGLCDEAYHWVGGWRKDVARIARKHRDPFEAILPVLEADSPVAVYARIPREILSRRPDPRYAPLQAAEAVRAFLMVTIGLHTGFRQRNLRELRICLPGVTPTPLGELEALCCGELFWDDRSTRWAITAPPSAFKNGQSSYFNQTPYRAVLPDVDTLYEQIAVYLRRDRPLLLNGAPDPQTFFVKSVRKNSRSASYCCDGFHETWRRIIERYGVYNPFTGRGAIAGLIPHGPHSVRDVLATHVLKKTGSYDQAGFAIQDTPDSVSRAYARFMPNDKAAVVARLLEEVWR